MQLSFYAEKSGKLVLSNVESADKRLNSDLNEVTLTVKGGEYNTFDSLIVTGNGDVTATFNGERLYPGSVRRYRSAGWSEQCQPDLGYSAEAYCQSV